MRHGKMSGGSYDSKFSKRRILFFVFRLFQYRNILHRIRDDGLLDFLVLSQASVLRFLADHMHPAGFEPASPPREGSILDRTRLQVR